MNWVCIRARASYFRLVWPCSVNKLGESRNNCHARCTLAPPQLAHSPHAQVLLYIEKIEKPQFSHHYFRRLMAAKNTS